MLSLIYAIITITLLCVDYTDEMRGSLKLQTFKTENVYIMYSDTYHISQHLIINTILEFTVIFKFNYSKYDWGILMAISQILFSIFLALFQSIPEKLNFHCSANQDPNIVHFITQSFLTEIMSNLLQSCILHQFTISYLNLKENFIYFSIL